MLVGRTKFLNRTLFRTWIDWGLNIGAQIHQGLIEITRLGRIDQDFHHGLKNLAIGWNSDIVVHLKQAS